MSGVVAFEGELNSIVKEYLEFNNFKKSQGAFERECTERGRPVTPTGGKPKRNHKSAAVQREMLQSFTDGHRKKFFKNWEQSLPESMRNEDAVAQKLEFYLNIYFAIYPLKYGTDDPDGGMNSFKAYLETRGSSLSQTTEFLPFYALPFVPNPRAHPSYKELFSDRWVPDLQTRLEKFLTLALQSKSQPRLFELFRGGSGRDIQAMQQQIVDAERKSMTYLKRYNRVQADYHNLIGITADLVDSLEATVQGHPISPEYLQEICMRLFSNQLRQTVDFTRPGTAAEVLRQSVAPPQGLQHSQAEPGKFLDFDKIKYDMIDGHERDQGLLLQALRWKLTKSSPGERDAILASYLNNDLLGCAQKGPHQRSVQLLFNAKSELIRQYTARLFNAFASLSEGRSYLALNNVLLRTLIENLRDEDRDSLTRENVLGCLQKLSLRRQLQTMMIDEGIISWLVSVLDDNDSLSDYTLEYSVALLMNLCLRSAGKKKCSENAHQVLKVLSDLLGHENQEIIPYVNGALYSILAIPSIREEAKAMGMEEILKCFLKDDQPDMNRQIEFIIKQLNSMEEPDDMDSDDEDDDEDEEDQDAMEADLDKNEMLKPQHGELIGDRLLNTQYITTVSPTRRKKTLDGLYGQEEVLTRPITPSNMKGQQPVVHVQPKSSRPPTGQHRSGSRGDGGRPSSRDIHRPPTRSGSRPNSAQELSRPPSVPSDHRAEEMLSQKIGQSKKLAQASEGAKARPSQKAIEKLNGQNTDVEEYSMAFSSRSRIARTPDPGARPTSRGSVGDGPTPQPKYSESLPTSRPGSGGRPTSSSGRTKTPSPRPSTGGNGKPTSRGSSRTRRRPDVQQ